VATFQILDNRLSQELISLLLWCHNLTLYFTKHTDLLRPEFFFAGWGHLALALGAGVLVPNPDFIAATLQTQAAHFASVRWCHVGNDATNHQVLDGVAVGT
jgi:hypothetical protein